MAHPTSTLRLLTGIMVGLLVCFTVQGLAYYGFGCGTGKTESNYFSTISRFQSAVAPGAEIALVGSSISGRLPGRESGNQEIANLGSDGGSSLDGLALLNEGLVGRLKWWVLETNTAFSSGAYVETPAVTGARRLWFRVGGTIPLLGASARPTGMLYSGLKGRNQFASPPPFTLPRVPSAVPESSLHEEALTVFERERIQRLSGGLLQARKRGTRILMVRYPAGLLKPKQVDEMNTVIAQLHQQTGAPYLDLDSEIPRSELVFTDNVHLSPESAARVLATVREAIRRLEQATQ